MEGNSSLVRWVEHKFVYKIMGWFRNTIDRDFLSYSARYNIGSCSSTHPELMTLPYKRRAHFLWKFRTCRPFAIISSFLSGVLHKRRNTNDSIRGYLTVVAGRIGQLIPKNFVFDLQVTHLSLVIVNISVHHILFL